jgi:hypothetical protein
MPLTSFAVERYRLIIEQFGPVVTLGDRRILILEGPEFPSGRPCRIHVYFETDPAPPTHVSKVWLNDDDPDRGVSSTVFCYKRDYAEWYDVLRNERPITCGLSYDHSPTDPEDPEWYLLGIQLYTSLTEPPGEGPEDLLEPLRNAQEGARGRHLP